MSVSCSSPTHFARSRSTYVIFKSDVCCCCPCFLDSFKKTSSRLEHLYMESNTCGDSSARSRPDRIRPIWYWARERKREETMNYFIYRSKMKVKSVNAAAAWIVLQPYRVRLSGFFDIMCCDDDGLLSSFCDMNEMVPYTLSKERINANGRLWRVERM